MHQPLILIIVINIIIIIIIIIFIIPDNIAHNLITPIQSINMGIELLKSEYSAVIGGRNYDQQLLFLFWFWPGHIFYYSIPLYMYASLFLCSLCHSTSLLFVNLCIHVQPSLHSPPHFFLINFPSILSLLKMNIISYKIFTHSSPYTIPRTSQCLNTIKPTPSHHTPSHHAVSPHHLPILRWTQSDQ